ncbi:hypothetical protein EOW65_09055 [Sinirhodobacter ferrireducens]|uniref:HIG1 domain-containing protein n=1 Tax=Paenirhodobacter ferrireducens TaxID=1215032 RepID=A0A443LJP3_9RHOB|nr:hypothetical protein [Sinirhodobacter ferrireducens]RWR49417.1 hypothetical protein EOW65_09055 [Sinirhodobacter ferrireducens]
MDYLIWPGAIIVLAGLAGIVWSVLTVGRARRAGLSDAALRERLQHAVLLNIGALLVSALGLMMVVVGVILR